MSGARLRSLLAALERVQGEHGCKNAPHMLLSMASSPKVKTPPATPQAINKFFEEQMQSSVPTQHRMAHMINGTLDSANIAPMGGASPRSPSYCIRPATDSALETRSDCVAF